jgi:hypothetical protein
MPLEKALRVQRAQLEKQQLQQQVAMIQTEVKRRAAEIQPHLDDADQILREYRVGPADTISFETGAITRASASPAPPDGGAPSSK